MKVSKNALDFGNLITKYYKACDHETEFEFEKEEDKLFESLTSTKADKAEDKSDPLDYAKWQKITSQMSDLERQKEEHDNKEDKPIWGCTNDHRKVNLT